jgi:RHS repeat-associated protein
MEKQYYFDAEMEQYLLAIENRANSYDPTIGKFTDEDPIPDDANDMNFLRYVANNPTHRIEIAQDAANK